MNNLVLQKLIHMYQDPHFLDERVGMPAHFNTRIKPIPNKDRRDYFRSMSGCIQQAAKFYIDQRDETAVLRKDEVEKIIPTMPVFLPYENCFVQLETKDAILNVIMHEIDRRTEETDEPVFMLSMIPYVKKDQMFTHDYSQYGFTFHRGEAFIEGLGKVGKTLTAEDYTYWVHGAFEEYLITDPDENGQYGNPSLEEWTQICSSMFITLNIMLSYPEITEAQDVRGRPNTTVAHGTVKKMRHSILRNKPAYEHKTLKLDMYGNNDGTGSNSGARSSGTAFHTVRKHIRRLPNGRTTFVKAHFRGSKEVGTVTKDYEIVR